MSRTDLKLKNFVSRATEKVPGMVGRDDLDYVKKFASELRPSETILEFGPWLGAISTVLAASGELHVIDSFEWTKAHDAKVPGLLAVGDSFREVFEQVLATRGSSAIVHTGQFENFRWRGNPISLCVIDAPKSAADLYTCLAAALPHLAPNAKIIVKNALNPLFVEMAGYIDQQIGRSVLIAPPQKVSRVINLIVLAAGPRAAELQTPGPQADGLFNFAAITGAIDLDPDHPFRLAPLVQPVSACDWQSAYKALAQLPAHRGLTRAWDKIETKFVNTSAEPEMLAIFSEIVAVHNNSTSPPNRLEEFHSKQPRALRAFWINNWDKDWRGSSFCPEIIAQAFNFGYMGWPSKIRELIQGKDMLDVGCGPGLHGIGFLAAGAKSYLGLDPIVKLDRDRVKNLSARNKMGFGWTPNQISERISPWHVDPTAVGDTPQSRRFDAATLHNVTEHLHGLDGIFADIALRLRPGGTIIYNHHNFFCWNGHHLPPKTVAAIDLSDPGQLEMIDWGHVAYEPAPEHYIARGLNRHRLDEVIALTEKYFTIDKADEIPSRPETGIDRLTDEIRARYPDLTDRDLTTQNLFCVATLKI